MTAQAHHAAMAHVAPVRRELGARTLFNLLGPLSNPAGVRRALIGVYSEAWMEPIAETLNSLGAEVVWVVHGADGLTKSPRPGRPRCWRWSTARSANLRLRLRKLA